MLKHQAIELLGGTVTQAAVAIGINPQAVSQWPEELPRRLADRVLAACVRAGISIPPELAALPTPEKEVSHG